MTTDASGRLEGVRIRAVESGARDQRRVEGRSILGRAEVIRQRPTDRPESREARQGLSPRVASVNESRRIEAIQRKKAFLAAYRAARDLWKAGASAIFPAGTYWLRKFAGVSVETLEGAAAAATMPT